MRLTWLVLLLLVPTAVADESAAARDKAIVAAIKHLDEAVWKLQSGGSPRREYTLANTGWAYLLAVDKVKGGKKLPARKQQIGRIHKELVRYVERVETLYEKDAKKKRPSNDPFGAMRTAQYTWPLSVAAQYFAESAARGKKKGECRRMLKAIAKILGASQQKSGGWGHDDAARPGMGLPPIKIPKPGGGNHEYPGTLLCASHCALAAVGSADRALKTKKPETADRARAYFAAAQSNNGTFPYDPSQSIKMDGAITPMGALSLARTSGAVYALLLAGEAADSSMIKRAIEAIDKQPEMMSEGHGSAAMALQYGALLADARGPRAWRIFRQLFVARILAKQEDTGAFLCIAEAKIPGVTVDTRPLPGVAGRAMGDWAAQNKTYVTAIHTLILLLDRTDSRIAPNAPAPKGPVTAKEE